VVNRLTRLHQPKAYTENYENRLTKIILFFPIFSHNNIFNQSRSPPAIGPAITRDFNFAEPLTYGLIIIQGCISLAVSLHH